MRGVRGADRGQGDGDSTQTWLYILEEGLSGLAGGVDVGGNVKGGVQVTPRVVT